MTKVFVVTKHGDLRDMEIAFIAATRKLAENMLPSMRKNWIRVKKEINDCLEDYEWFDITEVEVVEEEPENRIRMCRMAMSIR